MTHTPIYRDPLTLRQWAADYDRRAAEYRERGMVERAQICEIDAQALRDEAAEIEMEKDNTP